ncbi:Signal recognition particle subunit SRP72 [Daldinia childiae]|uniref:Signal recognition particle subunit SRP72 n=1 Tax=Daldinia childiae TaxID=326645 RepID=UPI001447231E|nr:Signal recognition particle subunit SRP72 [Daldinia childiae]KAF3065192.1 Signal recognition particle subunit SRP72 [Daldinia childiae]
MASAAANLTSLLRASTIQDHDEILKAANAAIKASKKDTEAHKTRIIALLKLDRFEDALRAIAEGGDELEKEYVFEKSYALYKSGQLDDAAKTLEIASSSSKSSRPFRHLAAQIAYRAEKFPDAADAYHHLLTGSGGLAGEENDLNINLLATNAQLEWNGLGYLLREQERQPSRDHLEAFETAYNAACTCIARGDFNRASVFLKRAQDLCEASEDLSADEKKAELLPIMVQHAYVLARLGKETEAAALHRSIVLSEIPEAPTRAVAQNNEIAIGAAGRNPFLTQRLFQSATKLSGNDKLFAYQTSTLKQNEYAIDLQTQKFDGIESSTSKLILQSPSPTSSVEIARLGVINAAAHTHLQTGVESLKQILPLLEKRPTDIGLLLTIIQLYVQLKKPGPALTLLEAFLKRLETASAPNFEDVRFAPGLVAVTVALYRLQGRQNSIRTELARASTHWRSKSKDSASSLLREAGIELLKSSSREDIASAGESFEALVAQSSKDAIAVAGLVASFANEDFAKIETYLPSLTPIERLTAGATDVQALVASGVASIQTPAAPTSKKRPADHEPEKPAAKRRRKKRLPKNYEEGKLPDPERWLPLRDRSTYRPKGKKGRKRAQESTQGGVVKEEETLELVGGAGAVKVEKASGVQGGKKKKKGGKK